MRRTDRNIHRATAISVDEYIERVPPDAQTILRKIWTTIRNAAPDVKETISYQIPTFTLNGPLIHVAAYKTHFGLYPITAALRAKFKKKLSGHLSGKGTARFSYDRSTPYTLIERVVKFRVKENLANADRVTK